MAKTKKAKVLSESLTTKQLLELGSTLVSALGGWPRMAEFLCLGLEVGRIGSVLISESVEPKTLKYRLDEAEVYKHADYPVNDDGAIIVVDREEYYARDSNELGMKHYRIDQRAIRLGLAKMLLDAPHLYHQLVTDNGDAITGDAFVQFCAWGKLL